MSHIDFVSICRGGSALNVLDPNASSGGGNMFEQFARSARSSGFERTADAASGAGKTRRVTLYRNGFTLDDGPLRDFTTPENANFLRSIERGDIPEGTKSFCFTLIVLATQELNLL